MAFNHPVSGEMFYMGQALFKYRRPFDYFKNRFILAPKILESKVLGESTENSDLSIHMLLNARDFINSLWSLGSLMRFWDIPSQIIIHNDGTLDESHKDLLKEKFPGIRIVDPDEALKAVVTAFPKHPSIACFRKDYDDNVYLKKLIDISALSDKKFQLVVDSDILWFKRPDEIISQIKSKKTKSLMMYQSGHPNPVYFKNGTKLDEYRSLLNAGIVLYRKDNLDLSMLSYYLNNLDCSIERTYAFMEQAGHTYCLKDLKHLPEETYRIDEGVDPATIARHYIGWIRSLFYIEGIPLLGDLLSR